MLTAHLVGYAYHTQACSTLAVALVILTIKELHAAVWIWVQGTRSSF